MTKTWKITGVFLILILIALNSCDKKVGKLPQKSTAINCDTITYSTHLAPILESKCGAGPNCHVAGGQAAIYLMSDYQKALSLASLIENDVFVTGTMPKSPTVLTQDEKAIIRCWLDNGKKP